MFGCSTTLVEYNGYITRNIMILLSLLFMEGNVCEIEIIVCFPKVRTRSMRIISYCRYNTHRYCNECQSRIIFDKLSYLSTKVANILIVLNCS